MDFNAIAATLKDRFEIEIVHPQTGEGGWFIELASPCHAGAQAKVRAILDRIHKRKFTSSGQDEKDMLELIEAQTLGWRGLKNGEDDTPYTPETWAAILADPRSFWVKKQVMDAVGDPSRPFNG